MKLRDHSGGSLILSRCFSALALHTVACALALQSQDPFADPRRQVMVNIDDVEYISYFSVGHQTISGVLDSGSFELVVFSSACKSCGQAAKYDAALSTAHKHGPLTTVQSYGSGDTYSQEASDLLSIGPFKEKQQMFWEVVDARMPRLRSTQFQAVIGVGPPEAPAADAWAEARRAVGSVNRYFLENKKPPADVRTSAKDSIEGALEMDRAPPLLQNFNVSTFAMCMGAHPKSDGYFTWNDDTPFKKPHLFTRVPINGDHSWSTSLRNVRMTNPGTFTSTKLGCFDEECGVLIDSGTSLIAAPATVIRQIQDLITQLEGDCTNLHSFPTLVFELGGVLLSLPPDAYVAAVVGTVPEFLKNRVHVGNISTHSTLFAEDAGAAAQCKVLLMESYMQSESGGPLWILGFPFFRKYYTSFHLGDDVKSRALYLAEASDDCYPAESTSLARSRPHIRHIDVSRLHVPPLRVRGTRIRRL